MANNTDTAACTLSDGWHNMKDGKSYYVSDGRIVRGLSCDGLHTLYPYRWRRELRCYVNVTPRATYNALRYLRWF
nr:MAG TPA: hypothetical protein [Caudoviricetes sp.]